MLSANVGVSPGTAISGFPPGMVGGTTHAANAHALQAQSDLVVAYDAAADQASDAVLEGDLGGRTLAPGVYKTTSSIGITGPLVLDGKGDPDAAFVFQIGSTLTTATSSSVLLINGAQSCNVFWQVSSSATLGTSSTFIGNILALTSISVNNGAVVDGRALARNGSVTLNNNTFIDGPCETGPSSTTSPSGSVTATSSPSGSVTATSSPSGSVTATSSPSGSVTATSSPHVPRPNLPNSGW